MAASSPIWNHIPAHGSPLANPRAMSGTGSSSSASDSSSTISANDFLTLLVTEMKNQDPTSATDPNQYINQLVNVNSLQQLIQINQTLSSAANGSGSNGSVSGSSGSIGASAQTSPAFAPASGNHLPAPSHVTSGNLDMPAANPAARRIAQALSGGSPR